MTIEEAATELMKTYSRFGVDKKELIRMMKNGVRNYDLTVASTFHGLRMMLSEQFHTQELFSQRDIAEMLDISCLLYTSNNGGGGLAGKMTPCAVLVIQNGTTKLVNVKNQDGLTKVLDMVPDFVNRFAPGGDNSADETVDSEEN